MNEIGYQLLLDTSTKRKITILNLLLESDLPILISELAEACEVSQKTLRRDIQTLSKLFPDSMILENSSLILNISTDMNPILSYIEDEVKNNILFSIVEDTFTTEVRRSIIYLRNFSLQNLLSANIYLF
ncbi:HTH domain-containing protein [Enterococcus termitis]